MPEHLARRGTSSGQTIGHIGVSQQGWLSGISLLYTHSSPSKGNQCIGVHCQTDLNCICWVLAMRTISQVHTLEPHQHFIGVLTSIVKTDWPQRHRWKTALVSVLYLTAWTSKGTFTSNLTNKDKALTIVTDQRQKAMKNQRKRRLAIDYLYSACTMCIIIGKLHWLWKRDLSTGCAFTLIYLSRLQRITLVVDGSFTPLWCCMRVFSPL